ncbi:MAG TPA: DUF1801 domain-containing protein [Vicinamibacterales bacterium]|nr:DUF1801 domain-containing protein [Vicinamibacterales bacterium]
MAELKTKATKASVSKFLESVPDASTRKDCKALIQLMKKVTKSQPKMWGPSIVGFGDYHYKYDTGREADWFCAGFSPRKNALTLYIMSGFPKHADLMSRLGKHKTGKGCLYIRQLSDVDTKVLEQLIERAVKSL